MKITFILRSPRSAKESPVIAYVHFSNDRVRLPTGVRVLPKNWNQDRRRVKRGAIGETVTNSALAKMESEIAGIFASMTATGVEPTPDVVRARYAAITGRTSRSSSPDVLASYDAYLERSNFRPGTIKCHRKAKNHLSKFAEVFRVRLAFDRLDLLFWERFGAYLLQIRQMSNESTWNIIKSIRAFLADAVEHGLTTTEDFRKVTRKSIPKGDASAKPYLSHDELARVQAVDLADAPRLARVRDLFVFLCYTGIRFGDSQQLRPENVHGDVLRIVLEKNRKQITVPLLAPARGILERYGWQLPRLSNQKANSYLAEVLTRAEIDAPVHVVAYRGTERIESIMPKHEACGMHTSKRTFVSLLRQRGVSVEALMQATGNSRATLERYILRTDAEALDEIREAWAEV